MNIEKQVEKFTNGQTGCISATIKYFIDKNGLTEDDVVFIERKRKTKNTIYQFNVYTKEGTVKIFVDKK